MKLLKLLVIVLLSSSLVYAGPSSSRSSSSSSSRSSSPSSSRSSPSTFSRPSTPSSSRSSPSTFSKPSASPSTRPSPKPTTKPTVSQQQNKNVSRGSESTFSKPVNKVASNKPLPKTAIDKKVEKVVTTSGKSLTKDQAISEFKSKHASQYTTKFKSEPKTRPTYIPPSTNVGGRTVNITYNSGYGGYGYMHPLTGTWMMFDIMSDAMVMSSLMNNHGYRTVPYTDAPVVYASSWYGTFIFLTFLIGAGVILCFVIKGL